MRISMYGLFLAIITMAGMEYTHNDTSIGSNVSGSILDPPVQTGPGRKIKHDEFLATLRLRL